jgi:hypothetical protein
MLRNKTSAFAALPMLAIAVPSAAQDYLGTHLQTIQEENLQRHQQQRLKKKTGSAESRRYDPPISGQARHAAMARHHREYARVMKERGVFAADQWLADQVAAGR